MKEDDEQPDSTQPESSEPPSASAPPATETSTQGASAVAAADPEQPPPGLVAHALRLVYWAVWLVGLPLAIAVFFVWALAPAGPTDETGMFSLLTTFVREQPVPVAILAFALAEVAIWPLRFRLPLAEYAYQALPAHVPVSQRTEYERARGLLAEGTILLDKRGDRLERSARTAVQRSLDALRGALDSRPYAEGPLQKAEDRVNEMLDAHFHAYRRGEGRESMVQLGLAVVVALVLRAFVFEAFKIPSPSMVPTLQVGDHLFVNKSSYGPRIPFTTSRMWDGMPPERGDVMVFQFPEQMDVDFIKRVIALPGDRLEARGGHPIINGWEVPSCLAGRYHYEDSGTDREGDLYVEWLGDEAYLTFYDQIGSAFPETQGPFEVKPGEVYVMGDNRHNSKDSRLWWNGRGGGVPFGNIKGRAVFIWLSVGDAGMDWSRFGGRVMGTPHAPTGFAQLEPKIQECLAKKPAVTDPPAPK